MMYNLEAEIDIEFIKDGDPTDAMDAARRIMDSQFPVAYTIIEQLAEIVFDQTQHYWARMAAAYVLERKNSLNILPLLIE